MSLARKRYLFLSLSLVFGACAHPLSQVKTNTNAIEQKLRTPFEPPAHVDFDVGNMQIRTKADYYYTLGEAYSMEGAHQRAIENFKLALIYDAHSEGLRLRLAQEYLRTGFVTEALEHAELVATKNPKNIDAILFIGSVYTAVSENEKAIKQYNKALLLSPENAESLMYLGAIYADMSETSLAIDAFKRLSKIENFPQRHLAEFYLARVYLEKKDYAAAEMALKQSVKIKPSFVDGYNTLMGLQLKGNRIQEALQTGQSFIKSQGPSEKICESMYSIFIEQKKYSDAYSQLQLLESISRDSAGVKTRMAFLLIEEKKWNEASKKLEQILIVSPQNDKALFYLGAVQEELGQSNLAKFNFLKIPSSSAHYTESAVRVSYILKNEGDLNGAYKVLETALEKNPKNPQIFAVFAALLDESKQYIRAKDILLKGIEQHPKNLQLKFYLGNIYDRLKDKSGVIEEMNKILAVDSEHAQALNYIAYTYAEMGENLELALKYAEKALAQSPDDGLVLDTVGWIHHKLGNYNEAVKHLEAALKLAPKESIIAEHLAESYIQMGLPENAKAMWTTAHSLEQDTTKKLELQKKIDSIGAVIVRRPASQ